MEYFGTKNDFIVKGITRNVIIFSNLLKVICRICIISIRVIYIQLKMYFI